jgi:hypothetical protein
MARFSMPSQHEKGPAAEVVIVSNPHASGGRMTTSRGGAGLVLGFGTRILVLEHRPPNRKLSVR